MIFASSLACASVYDYRFSGSSDSIPSATVLSDRLAAVLEPQGFKRLGHDEPIPQSGGTGYHGCPDGRDLVVFLCERQGRTSVHLFACHGAPRFVVIADSWTRDEPDRTRDLLSREFAAEIESTAIVLRHRYRLALE
jgi:hypothetical protein